MTVRVHNVILELDEPESLLRERCAAAVGLAQEAVREARVVRRALDARRGRVRFVYSLDADLADDSAVSQAVRSGAVRVESAPPEPVRPGSEPVRGRVVVVGCGPAGLFAALALARHGYAPLLVERGAPVAQRHRDVARFHSDRLLDPESNILFGAGGAGTYSDGKLRSRIRDPLAAEVLDGLIEAGGDPELRVNARPHVGTDRLGAIVECLCGMIERAGGEIAWRTRVTALRINNDALTGIETTGGRVETGCLLLAPGASARDTFRMLKAHGVALDPKPFQMGLRIEHPREMIDRAVYGGSAVHPKLGAAEYVLSAEGVTAFCICPGGSLVAASVEPGTVCTNGMSLSGREGEFTNAALVTTVGPDLFGAAALDGIAFQQQWERRAFELGGGDYTAPAQQAPQFIAGKAGALRSGGTYPLGVVAGQLDRVLPSDVSAALRRALPAFDRRLPDYAGERALLVGPETRASCPVRTLRDRATRVSTSTEGLYPAGEGSGYSSGILSSAVDGLRSARAVIARFAPAG